jgi:glycosyltransferase involved in cell wall biosynthesis
MPCYNNADTLTMALASLIAQSYAHWECILVDDGSTDDPHKIAGLFRDPRIRVFRHAVNLGRPAARQSTMAHATGSLIAMLDADDWIYTDKLQRQVDILDSDPSLSLVSGAFGIEDQRGRLCGVRGGRPDRRVVTRRNDSLVPHLPFAASMFRREIANGHTYDSRLEMAEDQDYLNRITAGRHYALLSDVLYVYRELRTATLDKALRTNACLQKSILARRADFPVKSLWLTCREKAKRPVYRTAHALGMWDAVVSRRSRQPTGAEQMKYLSQAEEVRAIAQRITGTAKTPSADTTILTGQERPHSCENRSGTE